MNPRDYKGMIATARLCTIALIAGACIVVPSRTANAADVDCSLAGCGFGALVDTLSGTNTLNFAGSASFPAVTITNNYTTNVYLANGVYTYLYEFTQVDNIPFWRAAAVVEDFPGPIPLSGSLNWGVVTDLTTAGLDDCGDTGGLGCEAFVLNLGGSVFLQADMGFQFGVFSFGTGISSSSASPANSPNTFAFYLQSHSAPEVGAAFFSDSGGLAGVPQSEVIGVGPPVLVPNPSPVPEPATVLLVSSGLFVVLTRCWKQKPRSRSS